MQSEETQASGRDHYRRDVQGLRAVAALLVAVYHIWFHRVSGAVDLFFFISAFFMTASLLRRFTLQGAHRTTILRRFWSGLMKRMLPQAWSVLVVSLAATCLITPLTWWRQLLDEFVGAATFTVNWILAANGNNYLHTGDVVSPVQHYWAMAVQMQVYLVWPLLIGALVLVARKLKRAPAAVTSVGLSVIGAASLAYSVALTAQNQPVAYYDTFTRIWEFAAGALFAIALPHIRIPRFARLTAGWVGLIGLLVFGMLLDVSARFPGIVAAVPLSFAALIFLSHDTGSRWGTDRLLASRPLVWLGGISYGIYLWHWPLMTLWLTHNDQPQLTFPQGVVVIELAIVLAWLTTRFVERPIRKPADKSAGRRQQPRSHLPKALTPSRLRLLCLSLALLAAITTWSGSIARITKTSDGVQNPGAQVLTAGYEGPQIFTRLSPSLTTLSMQWPLPIGVCSSVPGTDNGEDCRNQSEPEDGSLRITAVGDSHTTTWMTALAPLASERGWYLRQLHMDMCPFDRSGDTKLDSQDLASVANCSAMNAYREVTLVETRPDIAFTTANVSEPDRPDFVLSPTFVDTIENLTSRGIAVVVVRDTPRYTRAQNDCAARFDRDPDLASTECTTLRDQVLDPRPFEDLLPDELRADPLVATLDFSDEFCPDSACPAAIGGVVTYIDNNHPTRQYVSTLEPVFDAQFRSALESLLDGRNSDAGTGLASAAHDQAPQTSA